jgi:phage shock protein E
LKPKEYTLVDVRTKTEVKSNSVDGVINIPMHDVLDKLDEFRNMTKPIIVFCVSGNRSGWVVDILKEKGINKIINGGTLEEISKLLGLKPTTP